MNSRSWAIKLEEKDPTLKESGNTNKWNEKGLLYRRNCIYSN